MTCRRSLPSHRWDHADRVQRLRAGLEKIAFNAAQLVLALAAAAGISAALYRRAATGEGSEVDVSLLGVGLWLLILSV